MKYRNFRFLWVAATLYGLTSTMNSITQSWLVLVLTDSPFLLGLVNLSRFIPIWFLGFFGGVAADRLNKRSILVAIQAANLGCTLGVALFYTAGVLQVWHLIVSVLIMGCFNAFYMPARATIIVDIVGEADLYNAMNLIVMTEDITNSLGFFLGGAFIQFVGIDGSYYFQAAAFGLSIPALLLISVVSKRPSLTGESAFKNLLDSLRYIGRSRTLIGLLAVATYWNLFISISGFRATLIPLFGRDVLNIDAAALGWLMGSSGLGGLVGLGCVAVLSQARPNFKHKGWLYVMSTMLLGASTILFAAARWFPLNFALWFIMGAASNVESATDSTLLLLNSSPEMRGRVMGARSQVICFLPVGTFFAAVMAQDLGSAFTIAAMGGLWSAAVLVTVLLVPSLWRSE